MIKAARDHIRENKGAWIIFGLFILAEIGNHRLGTDLRRICELSGPHDVYVAHPLTDRQEIDNICIRRTEEDSGDPFSEMYFR